MTIRQRRDAVKSATRDKAQLMEDLEAQRRKIIAAVKPFIKTELHNTIENEIKEHPEHTMYLGKEKLKSLKEAMLYLIYNSNEITESVFSKDKYWIHIDYQVDLSKVSYEQKYRSKREAKDRIISGIKEVMGYAGKLLIEYGYGEIGEKSGLNSKWQLDEQEDIVLGGNYSFPIPREIDERTLEYVAMIDELHEITYKILDMSQELNQQEAMKLWQEA